MILPVMLLTAEALSQPDTDPLAVHRPDAVYQTVLTDSLVERRVTSWYHGFYLKNLPEKLQKQYTGESWRREQRNYLKEAGTAGMDGPFATWSLIRLGKPVLDEMYETYGMMFPYYAHHSGHFIRARNVGALFVESNGQVACWDSAYVEVASEATSKWLETYGHSPWLSAVYGRDEPLNLAALIRHPAVVDSINREISERYDIELGLSPGEPDKPWYEWPNDPALLEGSPHEIALLRIAMWRWLNEQLSRAAGTEHSLVQRIAPRVLHIAYNRNAINIKDPLDGTVRHSLDFLDQARMYDVTDGFSADPYPAATLARDDRPRALYHVGFVSKLVTDLAAGKPVKMILQGFEYHGVVPTPENLREWVSQAAKAGVTHLEWYTQGCPRFAWPEVHAAILRLSRLWKDLPALAVPDTARIAVIFSDDSRAAANDSGMDAHYVLHTILGEKLGAWFDFVGENHVRRGLQTLDNASLVIAPQVSYVSGEFAHALTERVEAGATLMLLDPDALLYNIETGSLASLRMRLTGALPEKPREAATLKPSQYCRERFGITDDLPIYPGKRGIIARSLNIPDNARVLLEYEDGTPAAYSRTAGRGEVIVFGVMPFGNSDPAVGDSGWDWLFASVIDEIGIERSLPIWRFLMPATGGEIETFDPVIEHEN